MPSLAFAQFLTNLTFFPLTSDTRLCWPWSGFILLAPLNIHNNSHDTHTSLDITSHCKAWMNSTDLKKWFFTDVGVWSAMLRLSGCRRSGGVSVSSMSRVSLVTVWPSVTSSMGTHHPSHCLSHSCHTNTGIKTCDMVTNSSDPVSSYTQNHRGLNQIFGGGKSKLLDKRAASRQLSTQ